MLFLRGAKKIYHYYLSDDKVFVRKLSDMIGFVPANLAIFKLAFYHKSSSNSNSNTSKIQQNNERLEYLGDALLSTIVADYLFNKYPGADEGFLTKMRSKIVKRQTLNEIAEKMSIDIILKEYNRTRLSQSMLGNTLEALVGAYYIEKGYNMTKEFVVKKMLRRFINIHELENYDDNYKSQLLEWCQKHGKEINYEVLSKYKIDNRDCFKIAVLIDGQSHGSADDFNKKSAEQLASEKALKSLGVIQTIEA